MSVSSTSDVHPTVQSARQSTSQSTAETVQSLYRASQIKPNCAKCEKPITDIVVVALGQTWHADHFTCAHCNDPVRETTFRTHKELPYCERDYLKLYVKICKNCNGRISGSVLTALNDTWHQECFRCTNCDRIIGLREFTEINCSQYCMECAKIVDPKTSKEECKLESKLQSKLESRLESKLESKRESKRESKLESRLESKLKSTRESKRESKLETKVESKLEPRPGSMRESKRESKLE